jgi:hypothetical protein
LTSKLRCEAGCGSSGPILLTTKISPTKLTQRPMMISSPLGPMRDLTPIVLAVIFLAAVLYALWPLLMVGLFGPSGISQSGF